MHRTHSLLPPGPTTPTPPLTLQLDWLSSLARSPTATASFRCIPEYALSDALTWLGALINYGQSELVASKPVGLLIDSLVTLLDSPSCVRSPLIHNKIVTLLMSMMAPQLAGRGGRLGRGHLSPGRCQPSKPSL